VRHVHWIKDRGRILWRNPDKSHRRIPHCYSHSPLQLCLNIYISSNSRNLLPFLYSSATVHCKGERRKTWQKTITLSLWFKKSIQKPQAEEPSRLCPRTSRKLYVHEFGFSINSRGISKWRAFIFHVVRVILTNRTEQKQEMRKTFFYSQSQEPSQLKTLFLFSYQTFFSKVQSKNYFYNFHRKTVLKNLKNRKKVKLLKHKETLLIFTGNSAWINDFLFIC
jgi:hypothetical protein